LLVAIHEAGPIGRIVFSLTTEHHLPEELLEGLVRDGLATLSTEALNLGTSAVDVIVLRITDAGRLALDQ